MKYYRDKYKKRKKRRARIFAFIFALLFLLSFVYIQCIVNPAVVESVRQAVFSLSTSAVSDAVYDVLNENNLTYNDLVEVSYDQNGDISSISLQTVTVNLMARRFYQVAQVYLDRMGECGVSVPVGIFTGLPFLAGVGPSVNLRFVSIGAMTSSFESTFKTAGINQTNHSIFIRLYASVSMILPAYSHTIDSVTEMLVAENLIVGDVPEIYFGENASICYTPS